MTKRIMLDLETLDTGPDSIIVSIGACEFAEGVPLVDDHTFYTAVQVDGQEAKWSRTRSAQTEKWWNQQSAEARSVFQDPAALSLDRALITFAGWLNNNGVEMWGNGADFDCVILGRAYAACGLEKPWSYGANRCYRTLKNLRVPLGPGGGTDRVGTHHNALDDALYQAHYAAHWLKRLNMATTTLTSLESA